jgi:hypothetical protein
MVKLKLEVIHKFFIELLFRMYISEYFFDTLLIFIEISLCFEPNKLIFFSSECFFLFEIILKVYFLLIIELNDYILSYFLYKLIEI